MRRTKTKYVGKTTAAVKKIFGDIQRKRLLLIAAGLAHYFLMSLFPALAVLAAVMAYLPGGTQAATSFMSHVVPRQNLFLMEGALRAAAPDRGELLSVGIVGMLWLTSSGFLGIIEGLEIACDVHPPRPYWKNRIIALGLALVVGVLLLMAAIFMLLGPAIEGQLSNIVSATSLWLGVWPFLQWCLAALFTFASIELLYLLAPNAPAARRVTFPGALVAAASWIILSWGLGLYFHHFGEMKVDELEATLGTSATFLIWLYWGAFAILMGADINSNLTSMKNGSVRRLGAVLSNRTNEIVCPPATGPIDIN